MCTHQDGEPRRIPRPCAPTPAAIPIAPLQIRSFLGLSQRETAVMFRARVVVIAVHVPEQGEQMPQGPCIVDPPGLSYSVRGALSQPLQTL
jgi:hypothetical protein